MITDIFTAINHREGYKVVVRLQNDIQFFRYWVHFIDMQLPYKPGDERVAGVHDTIEKAMEHAVRYIAESDWKIRIS